MNKPIIPIVFFCMLYMSGLLYGAWRMDVAHANLEAINASLLEENRTLRAENLSLKEDVDALVGDLDRCQQELTELKKGVVVSRGSSVRRYSLEDIRQIAQVVHTETRGEPYEGKVAVARVILNRTEWHPALSVRSILTKPYQFAPPSTPDEASAQAVWDALNDTKYRHLSGFYNPDTATAEDSKSRKILLTIGGHVFY